MGRSRRSKEGLEGQGNDREGSGMSSKLEEGVRDQREQ